ncbi:MAG: putative sterol carrier protein [Paracoccaceae bacterium]|jgi:putative sterol carrier protein
MSDMLNAAADKLRAQMGANELDGSVRFDVEGLGAIRVEGADVSLDDSEADCIISADLDTFQSLVTGDLDPTAAFMSGKLRIDGDMSKAMQLSAVFG